MTRPRYMLGHEGWGLEYQNIVEPWVKVKNGVRVWVRVRVRVWVRFWVRVTAFSYAELRTLSEEKMTSFHSAGWKQVNRRDCKHQRSFRYIAGESIPKSRSVRFAAKC